MVGRPQHEDAPDAVGVQVLVRPRRCRSGVAHAGLGPSRPLRNVARFRNHGWWVQIHSPSQVQRASLSKSFSKSSLLYVWADQRSGGVRPGNTQFPGSQSCSDRILGTSPQEGRSDLWSPVLFEATANSSCYSGMGFNNRYLRPKQIDQVSLQ